MLGARTGAVQDAVTSEKSHGVVEPGHALGGELVSAISHPAVRLHEHGGPEVVLGVPPVRGARGHTARTEDTLIHSIEFGAILLGLEILALTLLLGGLALEPGLDGFVVTVKVTQIGHQVLHYIRMWKRLDLDGLGGGFDVLQTGKSVFSVNVHGTGTANTFSARASEREGRIHLILDLDQSVQDHRTALVEVNSVFLEKRLFLRLRVVSKNSKRLQSGRCTAQPS